MKDGGIPEGRAAIHAASWLITPGMPPIPGGGLVVIDGRIAAVGPAADLAAGHGLPVIDHPGCAIIPGFVNAHTHLELTHFPSWRLRAGLDYAPDSFIDWIIQLVKVKRALGTEDYCHSLTEGMRMCLESGTTAVGEILTDFSLAPYYRDSSLGGRVYFELLGQDQARFRRLLDSAIAACAMDLSNRFLPGLSPHSPYTIAPDNLPLINAAAAAGRFPLAIHLSESAGETAYVFDGAGPIAEQLYPFVGWQDFLSGPRRCSPTEVMNAAGLLTEDTLAVHCVHVTKGDAEAIRRAGASIVICPRSNDRLDVGLPPVALFKKLGIRLAIGTDSLASSDSLSIWDEIRFALDRFPRDLTPEDCFMMATADGAAAIGLADRHGSLAVGRRADFQVVSGLKPIATAATILAEAITAGSVEDVYVAGERYVCW